MSDLVKWSVKFLFTAVMWTFILNIRIDNISLFQRFSDIFVNNEVVYEVNSHLDELWYKVHRIAKEVINSKKDKHSI
jgi:hypothetical protein